MWYRCEKKKILSSGFFTDEVLHSGGCSSPCKDKGDWGRTVTERGKKLNDIEQIVDFK